MKESKLSLYEKIIIFLCILLKYLITYGISKTILYLYLSVLIFLVVIDIYNKKIPKTQYIKIIIFFCISAYFVVLHQDVNFLISCIMVVICLKKDNNSYVKTFLYSSILLYLITIFLNIMGVRESNNLIRITDGEIKTRYTLGFKHPNEVFLFFIPIALTGYYLYSDKKKFYIIISIVSYILYKLSYSRTGFITIILMIVLHILIKKDNIREIFKKCLPYMFVCMTVLSMIIAKLYGYSTDNFVSEALSSRPYFWNLYLSNMNIFSLIGNNVVENWHIDNFYLYLFIELGVIGYIIYYAIYRKSIKILKNFNEKLILIIFVFMIYGLTETNVIIGSINFAFTLQLKAMIEQTKKYEEIGENKLLWKK